MKGKFSKVLGVVIGILVLAILIFSVPAQALVLNLDLKDSHIEKGQKAIFDVSVNVNSADPVSKLSLTLDGKSDILCEFSPEGIILSGCKGMTIKPTFDTSSLDSSLTGSSYGYGYGYGTASKKLSYEIAIDTGSYETGDYTPTLTAYSGDTLYTQSSEVLTISPSTGITDSNDYISSSASRVCVSGWKCSDWSPCTDGKQTRTCDVMPNCYLENMPLQERLCVGDAPTLKLYSSFNTLRIGSFQSEVLSAQENMNSQLSSLVEVLNNPDYLVTTMFTMIVLIIIVLILIIFVLLLRRVNLRKRRMRRTRHLNRIRYKPVKQF